MPSPPRVPRAMLTARGLPLCCEVNPVCLWEAHSLFGRSVPGFRTLVPDQHSWTIWLSSASLSEHTWRHSYCPCPHVCLQQRELSELLRLQSHLHLERITQTHLHTHTDTHTKNIMGEGNQHKGQHSKKGVGPAEFPGTVCTRITQGVSEK